MEQKRTLWILIAAGIFLCIVFGAAYFMSKAAGSKNEETTAISMKESDDVWIAPYSETSKPSNQATETNGPDRLAFNNKKDNSDSALDFQKNNEAPSITTGLDYPDEGVTTATVEDSKGSDVDFGKTRSSSNAADGTVTTVFDFTSGNASSDTVTAENKAAEKAMKNADTRRGEIAKGLDESTTVKKSTTTGTTTKKATETPKTTTATQKSTTAVAKSDTGTAKKDESTNIPDRFWVQAASYSSKKKADEARAVLDKNMVQCEVFTFEMDGTLYYRVRVGPYTTKTEAAYWKKQVDAMEQFADAGTYIVNSSAPIAKK